MNKTTLASCGAVLALCLMGTAPTSRAAEPTTSIELTARKILDKMAATYATCKSHRDSGVVTNDFGPRPGSSATYPRHVEIKPFHTACFKLEGKFANTPTALWLDKATFLLVRVVQDTGLTLCTTVYKPQVNIEVPATDLEFNLPKGR